MIGLLVGMHFRPPAKAILASLRNGTPLMLDPEPDNPYDGDAIRVLVQSTVWKNHNPTQEQIEALESQGYDFDSILAEPEWMLGYLAASGNKQRANCGAMSNEDILRMLASGPCYASLMWGPNGEPLVRVQAESGEPQP